MEVGVTSNWSYKSCQAPVQILSPSTNQRPNVSHTGCPSCRPTNSVKAPTGKMCCTNSRLTLTLTSSHPGGASLGTEGRGAMGRRWVCTDWVLSVFTQFIVQSASWDEKPEYRPSPSVLQWLLLEAVKDIITISNIVPLLLDVNDKIENLLKLLHTFTTCLNVVSYSSRNVPGI